MVFRDRSFGQRRRGKPAATGSCRLKFKLKPDDGTVTTIPGHTIQPVVVVVVLRVLGEEGFSVPGDRSALASQRFLRLGVPPFSSRFPDVP